MAQPPVSTGTKLAALDEQVCLSLLAHQTITAKAMEAQTSLDRELWRQRDLSKSSHIRAHVAMQDDLSESDRESYETTLANSGKVDRLEEALTRQKVATTLLKQLLFDLENLVLTLTVTTRLFNSLNAVDIDSDSESRFDLRELDYRFGELCEIFADVASVRKESVRKEGSDKPDGTYSDAELTTLRERAQQIQETISNLVGHFDRTEEAFEKHYKGSLLFKVLALPLLDLHDWLRRNGEVIKELESCSTKQREDLVLWQERTELAYIKNDDGLATKAWQRKEQYGHALSKIEGALVAQVEAGALARQRLAKSG